MGQSTGRFEKLHSLGPERVAQIADMLEGGETSGGLIVGREKPAEIAHALKKLKDDPVMRKRLGRAARKRIEENFSLAAVSGALDRLLTAR